MRVRGWTVAVLAAVLSLFAALVAPAAWAQSEPRVSDAGGLHVLDARWLDGRLLEVKASTPALAQPTSLRVLLPPDYAEDSDQRFPVLYLLHGGGDNYRYWSDGAGVEEIVGSAPVIVVMPDGGSNGWYADWFNSGLGGPPKWETYHVDQLIRWVDANFHTRADRSGRAIAGLSMGGFGAMSYAARHPNLYVAATSFSGAVDILHPLIAALVTVSPLATLSPPTSVFGPPVLDQQRWREHDPTSLASKLRGIQLAIYTGDGRPGPYDPPAPDPAAVGQEAVVHQASLNFHRALDAAGVAHRLIDYGPGTHRTEYWQRDLREELPHLLDALHAQS